MLNSTTDHYLDRIETALRCDDYRLGMESLAAIREQITKMELQLAQALDGREDTESQVIALREEITEHDATFDLRWKADMRAIKRWQEATGRTLVWPDHADLCVWLLEQITKLEKVLERSQQECMEGHRAFESLFGEQMNGREFAVKLTIATRLLAELTEERDRAREDEAPMMQPNSAAEHLDRIERALDPRAPLLSDMTMRNGRESLAVVRERIRDLERAARLFLSGLAPDDRGYICHRSDVTALRAALEAAPPPPNAGSPCLFCVDGTQGETDWTGAIHDRPCSECHGSGLANNASVSPVTPQASTLPETDSS